MKDTLMTAAGIYIPPIPDTSSSVPNWLFITLTVFMLAIFLGILQYFLKYLAGKVEKIYSRLEELPVILNDRDKAMQEFIEKRFDRNEGILVSQVDRFMESTVENIKIMSVLLETVKNDINISLKEFEQGNANRSNKALDLLEERASELSDSLDRIYNTFIEILKNNGLFPCSGELALFLFDSIMMGHCLKKGIITAEAIDLRQYGSKEATIKALSNTFKDITEAEVKTLSKITYVNNNRLSDVLSPILEPCAWKDFVENVVTPMVNENWDERNTLAIQHNVYQTLWEVVAPMKLTIKEKGGRND